MKINSTSNQMMKPSTNKTQQKNDIVAGLEKMIKLLDERIAGIKKDNNIPEDQKRKQIN